MLCHWDKFFESITNVRILYICSMKAKKAKKKKANKYDTTLSINGSFLDVLKASASHANKKTAKKAAKKA
jgi:hypothetical protein